MMKQNYDKEILGMAHRLFYVMGKRVSVDDVQVLPGTTASYEIRVNVDGGSYSGFQYQMQFPATGFTLTGTTTVLSTWQGGSLSVGDLNAEGKANASAFSSADKEIPAGDIVIGMTNLPSHFQMGQSHLKCYKHAVVVYYKTSRFN